METNPVFLLVFERIISFPLKTAVRSNFREQGDGADTISFGYIFTCLAFLGPSHTFELVGQGIVQLLDRQISRPLGIKSVHN